MIRHIVLVKFAASTSAERIEQSMRRLAALKNRVRGMINFASGANESPEGLARGYGHAFTADFTDAAARDAYLADSEHKAAGAELVSLVEGGVDGLVVLDFEISG